MINWIIEWCAHNRFLVFTGTFLLVIAGIWSMQRIPLDALPDISDVQVIIHTTWKGEPPNIIEDQVTYPIVTALLAAPHVKAVRAQTMFNDSYVFVVFEDGTDMYWARSRVLEYLQTDSGSTARRMFIPQLVRMRPAPAGYTNTRSWTTRTRQPGRSAQPAGLAFALPVGNSSGRS